MQKLQAEAIGALQAMKPEARMVAVDYLKEMASRYPALKEVPLRLVAGGENVYAFSARRTLGGDFD